MTIAVALLSRGGIVLGADTEQTALGLYKAAGTKIRSVTIEPNFQERRPGGVCSIAGAGPDGAYIDKISDELCQVFLKTSGAGDVSLIELETALTAVYQDFYQETIVPFASYPESERPDVWLLIAVELNHQYAIWKTSKMVIERVHEQIGWAAIGIGSLPAFGLLSRFYRGDLNNETCVLLAAHIINECKMWVPGCGHDSQIVCIRKERLCPILQDDITQIESLLYGSRSLEAIEQMAIHHCFGTNGYENLKGISRIHRSLRKKFAEITGRWSWGR